MVIEFACRQHEPPLMQLPNVIGVRIGEKEGQPIMGVFGTHTVGSGNPQSGARAIEFSRLGADDR